MVGDIWDFSLSYFLPSVTEIGLLLLGLDGLGSPSLFTVSEGRDGEERGASALLSGVRLYSN